MSSRSASDAADRWRRSRPGRGCLRQRSARCALLRWRERPQRSSRKDRKVRVRQRAIAEGQRGDPGGRLIERRAEPAEGQVERRQAYDGIAAAAAAARGNQRVVERKEAVAHDSGRIVGARHGAGHAAIDRDRRRLHHDRTRQQRQRCGHFHPRHHWGISCKVTVDPAANWPGQQCRRKGMSRHRSKEPSGA